MEDDTKTDEISGAETLTPRKIIPAEGWAEVIRLRENADPGEEEACKKWGITGKTLSMHITRKRKEPGASALYGKKGWRKGAAEKEAAPKPDNFESKRVDRIEGVRERFHRRSEVLEIAFSQTLKEVRESGGAITMADRDAEFKAMHRAVRINRELKEGHAENLDTDKLIDAENLTELHVHDLSQPEIEVMRTTDIEDEDAFDISIEDLEVDDGSDEVVET